MHQIGHIGLTCLVTKQENWEWNWRTVLVASCLLGKRWPLTQLVWSFIGVGIAKETNRTEIRE